MNDLISKRAVLAKINLWVNGGCDTDKLIESIKKMSGGSLTDRPCEYCKNHVDGRCAAWDCAFDDVLSSSENPRLIDPAYEKTLNKWIGAEVLDKIRAEIEQLRLHKAQFITSDDKVCIDSQEVLAIIDKYKAEGSGEE